MLNKEDKLAEKKTRLLYNMLESYSKKKKKLGYDDFVFPTCSIKPDSSDPSGGAEEKKGNDTNDKDEDDDDEDDAKSENTVSEYEASDIDDEQLEEINKQMKISATNLKHFRDAKGFTITKIRFNS